MELIKKIWYGEAPLYIAFFGVGLLIIGLYFLMLKILIPLLIKIGPIGGDIGMYLFFSVYVTFYILWFKGTFTCAKNTKHGAFAFFAMLTTLFSILNALGVIAAYFIYFYNRLPTF